MKIYKIHHGRIFLKCIYVLSSVLKINRSHYLEANQVINRFSQTTAVFVRVKSFVFLFAAALLKTKDATNLWLFFTAHCV